MTQYDKETGINIEYLDPRAKGVTEETIQKGNEAAKFWYDLGVNPIPCESSKGKGFYLMEYAKYHKEGLDRKLFNKFLDMGVYGYGIGITCGLLHRGEYKDCYLNYIDTDNKKGTELMLRLTKSKEHLDLVNKTLTESYAASGYRLHIYFITLDAPLVTKKPEAKEARSEDKPAIEIYNVGKVSIVTNSKKENRNGGLSEVKILGTKHIIKFDGDQREEFQKQIDEALNEYGIKYLDHTTNNNRSSNKSKSKYLEEMKDEDSKAYDGSDRQGRLVSKMDSLIALNYPRTSLNEIKEWCWNWNQKHIVPPISEYKFDYKWNKAVEFVGVKDGYNDDVIQLIRDLEDHNIETEVRISDDQYEGFVKDLNQRTKKFKWMNSAQHIDPATDKLMEEHHFKTLRVTEEVLVYDGKVYTQYGEQKIKEELDLMRRQELDEIKRLEDLSARIDKAIKLLRKTAKDNNDNDNKSKADTKANNKTNANNADLIYQLINYQIALQDELLTLRENQMIVRNNFRNEVIGNIKASTYIDRAKFSADPNVLVVDNGVLKFDVKNIDGVNNLSWTLTDHSPDILSLNMLNVKYDPKAKCPLFIKFLKEIYPDKKDVINLIKMLGYLLYRACPIEAIFLFYGEGDNGKSVLLDLLSRFLGSDNMVAISLHDVCGENRFLLARLFGKMANIYHDIPPNKIVDASKIKNLAGGKPITAENKNQAPFEFSPYAKHLYSMNKVPESVDKTFGFYKRLVMFLHTVRIPKNKQDIYLLDKLSTPEELSGLLNLALLGLKMLFKDGGFTGVGNVDKIRKLYEAQSNLVTGFIDKYYEIDAGNSNYLIETNQIKSEFKAYIKQNPELSKYLMSEALEDESDYKREMVDVDNPIMQPLIEQLIGRQLKAMGIDKVRPRDGDQRVHYYMGLKSKVVIPRVETATVRHRAKVDRVYDQNN